MNKRSFCKILLITVFIIGNFSFLNASSDATKFYYAKKNYITSMLHNNKQKEIKYLKELVRYGTKLNKDVKKYKSELYRLDRNIKFIKDTPKKSIKLKKTYKKTPSKKYSIKSVYVEDNQIIINFNKRISKKSIKFFETKKKNRYYDTFDIVGNFKDAKPTKLKIDNVKRIKIVQYRYKTLRISLADYYNLKTYYIVNNKQIIIKVFPKKSKRVSKKVISNKYVKIRKKSSSSNKKKTIVIDAGHGGKDSGAVGPRRRYEKTVVLNVAKNLYYNLKSKGFKVYLTRNKDRYVSLRYRTRLANKKNADMFISIHANAARKNRAKKAHGVETYFLSPARSKRAKRVAALENRGDMNSMSYSSKNILLTLLNRSKITSSQKMAIDIQSHMLYSLRKYYGKNTILDGGVREGPFWVLVGAQMPSILIEVGYISHPVESKRIYTKNYQKKIAD
ncbi:MAG: N-acetylmuramoyl-L-alanine amidase, partial [Arcobacteraceae bacterium]|nr:N-acetylmuramoyl-L-alanine amidase [Arcobacteraceae bacterium]